jgi:hypothetical protein
MYLLVIKLTVRKMLLDRNTHNIANRRRRTCFLALARTASAKHLNALCCLHAAVIGDGQHCFLLNQALKPFIY